MKTTPRPAVVSFAARISLPLVIGLGAMTATSAVAQQVLSDPPQQVLRDPPQQLQATPVNKPMVLVIEGTESTGSVADTWTADDNRPSSPGRQKNRMNPGDSGEQPGLNQPPRRPREESGGPRSDSPGGMGSFPHSPPMPPHFGQNPAAPFQHPPHPMMLVPPGGHTGFDHVLDSPVIKKVLELMQENMELKAHMKIQSVQVESKMHVMELELKVDHLRRQLDQAGAELKEATISKERLEKRISELEHRSRILEERAKAIGERAARPIRPESMKRIESEWRRQFEEHSARGDKSHPPADAAYGREEPESADGVLEDDEKGEEEEDDDEEDDDEEEEDEDEDEEEEEEEDDK